MEERKMLKTSIGKYAGYKMANKDGIDFSVTTREASNASQAKEKIFGVEAQM